SSIFNANIWTSGIDNGGTLYLAANTYRQGGTDFWAGPVADVYNAVIAPNVYDSTYDHRYNKVWKVSKTEIDHHKLNYSNQNYVMPWTIEYWPGNGIASRGEADWLAPFADLNGNGIYEPHLGEHPIIAGDQAIFFMFN